MSPKLRVLHCPLNNSNNYWVLSRAERKLGLQSDLTIFKKYNFFNNFDKFLPIESVTLPNEFRRISFLKESLRKYDIFHFNFGQSIWDHPFPGFNYLDFPIIKKAGKKIVVTFQGDDIRQKGFFQELYGKMAYGDGSHTIFDKFFDFNKRLRAKKIDKYADVIFSHNPDIMHVLPKKTQFLPYPNVEIEKVKPVKHSVSEKIRIVHAPTDRSVKGTQMVLEVVKKLAAKYPIELLLVENVSHKVASRIYDQADIAIDQLKIGWYGGFAVEMMARGVPVISYVRESDAQKFVPFWREVPVMNADESLLEEALLVLIQNRHLIKKIGSQGRKFVEKYHDPIKIARFTKKNYEGICVG